MTGKGIQNILLTFNLPKSLYPLVNEPTHIKHVCHSIIDNIFTNVLNKDLGNWVIIDDTSDHFHIFCCANFVIKMKMFPSNYITERIMIKL